MVQLNYKLFKLTTPNGHGHTAYIIVQGDSVLRVDGFVFRYDLREHLQSLIKNKSITYESSKEYLTGVEEHYKLITEFNTNNMIEDLAEYLI